MHRLSRNIVINLESKFSDQMALQVFHRRVPFSSSTSILPNALLGGSLIRLKLLHLRTIHMLHNLIRLPLLKTESQSFVGIVFIIGLVFVVFYLNEVGVYRGGVEGEGDEGVYSGGLGDEFECPGLEKSCVSILFKAIRERGRGRTYLRVSELNKSRLILHNLISLVLTVLEQLRQRKPLPRHLIPIVRIHELIIIHAVRRIPLDLLDCRLAAVEVNDVGDEGLAIGREGNGLGGVGCVVFRWVGLAGFEVLARGGGGDGAGGDRVVVIRHSGSGAGGELAEGCVGFLEMGD